MDSVKSSEVTRDKSKLARAIAKVLHIHSDGAKKTTKSHMIKDEHIFSGRIDSFADEDDEQRENLAKEAFFAGIFAGVSSVKAAYAQMQLAECPYDPEEIQTADETIVSELKKLSDLKQLYVKKQYLEISSESRILSYEMEELKSLILMYQVSNKKLDSQLKLKDSEVTFLKAKLAEVQRGIKLLEKNLSSSRQLTMRRNLSLSDLNPSYFMIYYEQAVKSIQSFMRSLINGMESADWNFDAAANAIEPGISFWKSGHKCFVFESFVCREMFDGFNYPKFLSSKAMFFSDDETRRQMFLDEFLGMNSMNATAIEYLKRKQKSDFTAFCQKKYSRLMNPKMEAYLFGNMDQWNLVNSGEYPETPFFSSFIEMAKSIWLLHCLAFAMEREASIFRASKGSRFSEVWMESVNDEAFAAESDPQVAFNVVPGFRIDGTVIQCQVYLC